MLISDSDFVKVNQNNWDGNAVYGNLLQRGFQRGNVETSGESGKVTKENEMETLLLFTFFFTTQDLSQAGGTTCLGLQAEEGKIRPHGGISLSQQ